MAIILVSFSLVLCGISGAGRTIGYDLVCRLRRAVLRRGHMAQPLALGPLLFWPVPIIGNRSVLAIKPSPGRKNRLST